MEPARFLYPWDSPGENLGVGCHFLLQGIFLNTEIEPRSPTLQADSLPSEPPGAPSQVAPVVNAGDARDVG